MKNVEQHTLLKSVLLHLLPGVVITAVSWVFVDFLFPPELPKAVGFYAAALISMPILFCLVMKIDGDDKKISDNIRYRDKTPPLKLILLAFASLAFAVAVFLLTKPIAGRLQAWAFSLIGDTFDIAGYLVNPAKYSKNILIITWALALISTSTFLPFMEEVYFRGYLLPRISRYGFIAPVIGAVLFSVYHFFSFWLIPIRIIATFPMIFLVWKYKDIRIGIYAHIALNLIGDSITAIPVIFF